MDRNPSKSPWGAGLAVILAAHGQLAGLIMAGFWLQAKAEERWPHDPTPKRLLWIILFLLGLFAYAKGIVMLVKLDPWRRKPTSQQPKDE